MKKSLSFLIIVGIVSLAFGQLNNPAVYSTNPVYSATAGRAFTSDDGTNALAKLAAETNRSIAVDTNLLAIAATTTGRVAVLEAFKVTATGQVAALQAVDVTTTGRVSAVEYKLGILMTNTYITGIFTNGAGGVTNYSTTNHVFYLPR